MTLVQEKQRTKDVSAMRDWPSQQPEQILTVFFSMHYTMAAVICFTVLAMIACFQ